MSDKHVRVGIAVIIQRGDAVLVGRRLSTSHGDGTWQFPGGHLDYGETPDACAVREAREETGLDVRVVARGPWTSDLFAAEEKHYITLFMLAECHEGEPVVMEPEKCAEWRWVAWDDMPSPVFGPIGSVKASGWRPGAR